MERDTRVVPGAVTRLESTDKHFKSFTRSLQTALADTTALGRAIESARSILAHFAVLAAQTKAAVDSVHSDTRAAAGIERRTFQMHRAMSPSQRLK